MFNVPNVIKKIFIKINLLAVGVLILFLIGEVLVRFLVQLPKRVYEFDPLTGIRHVPDNVFSRTIEGNTFQYTTNKAGFLDREYSIEKPPNTMRIVVLGDSITEGAGVDQDERFSELFEQKLFSTDSLMRRGIEVLNFGVVETGTVREYLILKHKALLYNPDAVVLVFYINDDVFDNYRINTETIREYSAAQSTWGLRSFVTRSRFAVFIIQQIRVFDSYNSFPNFLRRHLVRFGVLVADRKEVVLSSDGVYPGFLLYAQDDDQRIVEGWNKTEEYFVKIHNELKQRNIPLFVFIVPSHEQIYPEVWERILREYPAMQKSLWNLEKPNVALHNILRKNKINFVDTTPFFQSLFERNHEQLFYSRDGHLTQRGHVFFADIILQTLATSLQAL